MVQLYVCENPGKRNIISTSNVYYVKYIVSVYSLEVTSHTVMLSTYFVLTECISKRGDGQERKYLHFSHHGDTTASSRFSGRLRWCGLTTISTGCVLHD